VEEDHELLKRMGLEVDAPTGGCCGQAGAWGFEAGHEEISRQIGEHALLPAVRSADPRTLVIANGFSCKTQIEQGDTGRRALHVAELLRLAHRPRAVPDDHAAAIQAHHV
jgi:Fe-S oxidoreductase